MGQQASDMQGSFGGAVPVYRKRVTRLVNHLNPEAGRDEQHLSLENTAAPLPQLENVKSERHGRVAVLTLTREKALNALCDALVADLNVCLNACVADGNIGCIVLTGAGRAFAAGADIKEMADKDFVQMTTVDKFAAWEGVSQCPLPVIAAVNGFAFGGGCEVAMMCDIIIASEKAIFGQPEIKLGIIPGAGGTQRLIRAVGKSKAMELVLTGNNMSAVDAERAGLVSKVVPHEELMTQALKMATTIASMGKPSVMLGKEAVNAAYESTLKQGLRHEKKIFYSLFATKDQKEGMAAFQEKRKANFTHE